MLNRRHLRIKILHALYAYFQSKESDYVVAEKNLFFSIEKFRELYFFLLIILTKIQSFSNQRMEKRKLKMLPTNEDLKPASRFVDNKLLKSLSENEILKKEQLRYDFEESGELNGLIKQLFHGLSQEELYQAYVQEDQSDEGDRAFILRLFKQFVVNQEITQNFLEEYSIHWVDDLDLASSMVLKTLKQYKFDASPNHAFLPLYKDPEDERNFIRTLFYETINQDADNTILIKNKTQNWELDRIVLIDMILMKMALAEAKSFSSIPVKVTLNEYIELSKYYSTPKSNSFINGILDKLFSELKDSGEILKKGRGLLE